MRLLTFLLIGSLLCSPANAAVLFDSDDDIFNCGSPTALDNVQPLTVFAWVNITGDFGTYWFSDTSGIAGVDFYDAGTFGLGFFADFTGGGSVDLTHESVSNVLTSGTWHYIALTWDGTGTAANAKIYVDGTEVSYAVTTNGSGTVPNDASGNKLVGGYTSDALTGQIAYECVWKKVLTQAEIQQLGASRVKGICNQVQRSTLVLELYFDDEEDGTSYDGDVAVNRDGSGNNCTGDDGAGNTGLTATAGQVLSYM